MDIIYLVDNWRGGSGKKDEETEDLKLLSGELKDFLEEKLKDNEAWAKDFKENGIILCKSLSEPEESKGEVDKWLMNIANEIFQEIVDSSKTKKDGKNLTELSSIHFLVDACLTSREETNEKIEELDNDYSGTFLAKELDQLIGQEAMFGKTRVRFTVMSGRRSLRAMTKDNEKMKNLLKDRPDKFYSIRKPIEEYHIGEQLDANQGSRRAYRLKTSPGAGYENEGILGAKTRLPNIGFDLVAFYLVMKEK